MKSKVIKKIVRILLYFIGVLLLLFICFYYAFRSPEIQTWTSNQAGAYFSRIWGATVRVDGVDIEFWKKIVLEGVYVEDQRHDTLLYARKLKLDIGTFDRKKKDVFINDVILQNATIKMKKYKGDSTMNFQFIVDQFSSKDTSRHTGQKWKIGMGGITLDNVRFAYRIEKDTSHVKGINFSDILANSVSAKISDIKFDADTTRCFIENLSLKEKSGFNLKEFHAAASVSPVLLKFDQLKIFSNNSEVIANISFRYRTFDNFNHFNDSVTMKARFNSSNIEMADIAYFTDELYGMKKRVFLNGDASGTVSDLKGKNIFLVLDDETSFRGNLAITGLPDIDKTFMSFDAKELRTSKKGIESIPLPPFNEQHSISVPDNISLFGVIKFNGNFSGFYNDFVAYGKFNTALGQISTDISLKNDTAGDKAVYHGKFACTSFNIGKYFASEKYFGRITMNVDIDGKGLKKENANVTMEGNVGSFECNGYNYKNINVKGKFAKDVFDGSLAVKDENVDADFTGNVDFSKSPTQLNFNSTIAKADLAKLNFVKSDEYTGVSVKVDINAVGNNLDDVTGVMKLDSMVYVKGADVFDFNNLELSIEDTAGNKRMNLHSSIADAHINGKFKPVEVASCLNDFLSNYLPSYIPRMETTTGKNKKNYRSKKQTEHLQRFTFDVQIKNTDVVTRAFVPSLGITTPASVKGNYDEDKNDFSLKGDFPSISIQKYTFSKCNITASSKDNRLSIQTSCQRFALADSVWIDNISLLSAAANDTLNFKLNWHNSTVEQYIGNIPGYISFSEKPKIKLKFQDSQITIADSTWKIDAGNEIVMDSSFIRVSNLDFTSGNQRLKLEGNISKVKEDKMNLVLSSFSLANFNSALKGTGFFLNGTISGNTSFSNLYDKPVFGSSIDIQNLKVNKEVIGNGNLSSVYDSQKDRIRFEGGFKRDEVGNMKFIGNYFPSKKDSSLTVDATVNDIHLDFFEPFIQPNFQDLKGTASAQLQINGSLNRLLLSGLVKTKVDNIHVNYLGTDYHFNGDVQVEPNSFDFSKLHVYDVNNNMANIVNGKIFHTNFKDFQLDFDISTTKFLCLNTTEKDNSVYYGKVFATGIVNVSGYLDNINLAANVKTDKAKSLQGKNEYSQLFIPLSNAEEVGSNSFVTFIKNDTTAKINLPKYKVDKSGFTMDLKVEPTSDAQVQLIFDEKVGDVIKAKGTGNIEMVINEFGNFKMYGEYVVDNGDYLFTLKNVVNKKFKMENGGTIRWAGSPYDADININAVYTMRTSLSPLFPNETADIYKKRYPVECVMNLTGKLMAPDIKFDIKMPDVDDFIRQQAMDKFKNSENDLNKEVFALLVMNTFVPLEEGLRIQQPGQEASSNPNSAAAASSSTSSEMLSNQLSNWLSQISNDFDVGVHYRPGDVINNDQVELALSTQLFNDKLSIDGSVANNTNTLTNQNTSAIVGDVNASYKLTNNGKVRLKAFNKANEGDILNVQKGPWTQGVGILYREEFDTIGELYRRFLGKFKKEKNKNQP